MSSELFVIVWFIGALMGGIAMYHSLRITGRLREEK